MAIPKLRPVRLLPRVAAQADQAGRVDDDHRRRRLLPRRSVYPSDGHDRPTTAKDHAPLHRNPGLDRGHTALVNPPSGCRFHTRCPWKQETKCDTERPELRVVDLSGAGTGHRVACHWTEQIESGEIQPHTVEATVDETGAALASDAEAQRLTEDIPFA